MVVERADARATLLDVLDRVLDKGIVIDAWVRISLVGINLLTVEARVVVTSIETYILHSDTLGWVAAVAEPARTAVRRPSPMIERGPTTHRTPKRAA